MTANSHTTRRLACNAALLSLAPGFSRVSAAARLENRFNGFQRRVQKAAEAAAIEAGSNTRLKPGANKNEAARHLETTSLRPFRINYALIPV